MIKKKQNICKLQQTYHELKNDTSKDNSEELENTLSKLLDLHHKVYIPQPYISKENGIIYYDFLNYYFVHCLHTEDNPYRMMQAKTSQQVLRNLCSDWKGYCKSLKKFAKNPSNYTGKPEMPKYRKKDGRKKVSFTNQQCSAKDGELHFSFMPFTLKIGIDYSGFDLQEVRIVPMGTFYKLEIVWYKVETVNNKFDKNAYLGIDLGVNNFAAITNTIGLRPILINGKIIKNINQYYNKKRAEYQSKLPFQQASNGSKKQVRWSKKLESLTTKRNEKITYEMHKISKYIIQYCLKYRIGVIVVGLNSNWKQKSKMGNITNQNFVKIPYRKFLNQLEYKATAVGIQVIEREESYTSQASFLDLDEIPTYGKVKTEPVFSGVRKHRGMYVSKDNTIINADVNGSYNILRKEVPELFTKDFIQTLSYTPKRITL